MRSTRHRRASSAWRRRASAAPGWRRTVAALALLLPGAVWAEGLQSPEAIREAAEVFLTEELEEAFDQVAVEARGVDRRLRLEACDGELDAFVPHGRSAHRASTVGVSCEGSAPWTVYVRMDVEARTQMVVADRSLSRGSRLTEDDLRIEARDARRVRGEFFQDPEQLVGMEMSRSLREGTAVTGQHVQAALLVDRGDRVQLRAGNDGSIRITSRGRALERGREGDRIRVENLDSEREVQGRVVGHGEVRVSY